MNTLNPDQAPLPYLTEQAVTTCRDAYDTLRGLASNLTQGREEDRPETVTLSSAIERFVSTNLIALADITEVPRPPYLHEAAQEWLRGVIADDLKQEMLAQTEARSAQEIAVLLGGRTIRATSTSELGFGIGKNGSVTNGPGSPREVKAPFLEVYPAAGALLLGTPEEFYEVQLFTTQDGTTTQIADIEVW